MKKRIVSMMCGLLLIGFSGSGFGYFESGNTLLSDCQDENKYMYCLGYITSVSDAFETLQEWEGFENYICLPGSVTRGQLKKVVIKYLEENPVDLYISASNLVLASFIKAFPC